MSQLNPQIVEAIKKNNGWVWASDYWKCVVFSCAANKLDKATERPPLNFHNRDCPCRDMFVDDAHPVNCACQTCEPDDVAAKLAAMDDRIAFQFEAMSKRLDALEAGWKTLVSLTDEHEKRLHALEAKPATPEQASWKCGKCRDTKIVPIERPGAMKFESGICSCLAVGDTVTAEVTQKLPPGSRVRDEIFPQDVWWERTETGWRNNSDKFVHATLHELTLPSWEVIRIGPTPEATPEGQKHLDPRAVRALPRDEQDRIMQGAAAKVEQDYKLGGALGPAPVAPPPDDICKRWARLLAKSVENAPVPYRPDMFVVMLNSLGLPEMAAVCEAAKEGAQLSNYPASHKLQVALTALITKEAANG